MITYIWIDYEHVHFEHIYIVILVIRYSDEGGVADRLAFKEEPVLFIKTAGLVGCGDPL